MERTRQVAEASQFVIWLMDGTKPLESQKAPDWHLTGKLLEVVNKADAIQADNAHKGLCISALTGEGIQELKTAMRTAVLSAPLETDEIAVASRHADLLAKAVESLKQARPFLASEEWELLAYHLREAVQDLRLITGEKVQYDALDTIFAKFCIGK